MGEFRQQPHLLNHLLLTDPTKAKVGGYVTDNDHCRVLPEDIRSFYEVVANHLTLFRMATNSTIAALQPVVERYITASDGVQIYATAVGQSHLPSIVFVHGLAANALIWASILANSDLLKQFYLVAYDLRGHGRSGKPANAAGYLSNLFAEDFSNVVREFGLNAPVYVGWSYGGTVVADIAAHLPPGSISGAVFTSAVPWLSAFEGVANPSLVDEIMPGLMSFDNATAALESRIKIIDSLVEEPDKVPVETKWAWLGGATLVGPLTTQLLLSRQQDNGPLLKVAAAGLPTLLVTGGKDKHVKPEPALENLLEQHFSNLAVYHFPQGGHAMFHEFPVEYAREVGRFAASVLSSSSLIGA